MLIGAERIIAGSFGCHCTKTVVVQGGTCNLKASEPQAHSECPVSSN